MTEIVYSASPGFHLSHKDARILGPAFEALERKLRRPPTPADVATAAQNPKSPFHTYFEWDPIKQQQFYLLNRARYIITALDVLIPDHGESPVRAIIPMNDGSGGFMSTAKAVKERPDVIRAQVDRAKADAKVMFDRYQGWIAFDAFEPVIDWVESARKLAYET